MKKCTVKPMPIGAFVRKDELETLIKAKTERDLILGVAATAGCSSYRLDDLISALMKLNGIEQGDKNA